VPGTYKVSLSANGISVSRSLTVVPDPRVRVSDAGYRKQWDLTQDAIAALSRGMDASRDITRQRDQRTGKDAIMDSLRTLLGEDSGGLRAATGNLARLVGEIQEADAVPTRGMENAVRTYVAEVDGLIRRWRRVETMAAGGASQP